MEQTHQEKVDALIAEIGAVNFVEAVKGHTIQPESEGSCKEPYVWSQSQMRCVLDIGG